MNTNLIRNFKSGEQALAWAVVEQAIIDYRDTNSQVDKDNIISFLIDYLPKDKALTIINTLKACDYYG